MLRVNAINRQGLLKCLTFNPKSLVFKTVSVPLTNIKNIPFPQTQLFMHSTDAETIFAKFCSFSEHDLSAVTVNSTIQPNKIGSF